MHAYPDKEFVLKGLLYGFDLGYAGPKNNQRCNNNLGVNRNPVIAIKKVTEEAKLGRIAGPFSDPPFDYFKCSPLSLREKSTPGQYRLLHNLSYPYDEANTSVNGNIPRVLSSTKYATIEDAVRILGMLDSPYLAKSDIASAFRLLPLRPDNYNITGFSLNGHFYYDRCLPMGASSSCQIFERFSDALVFILKTKFRIRYIVKVLDDFLFIGESEQECQEGLYAFTAFCSHVGIPIAAHKTEGPARNITFLGIHIDTVAKTLSIPLGKIAEYRAHILLALQRKSCTLREIRSLTGKLNFVCRIIPVGRCFLRRLYDLTIHATNPHASITLPQAALDDLTTWLSFLLQYNAKELYAPHTPASHHLFADSSNIGFAATYKGHYLFGIFPQEWLQYDIQVREFYPILIMVTILAKHFANKHILVRSDNSSVVGAITNQTSRNTVLMRMLRKFVLILLRNNIHCTALHIEGKSNSIADALSRLQVSSGVNGLQRLGLQPHRIPVPPSLTPRNLKW